jgi:hypothetical protein
LTAVVYALFRYQSQTFNRETAKAMTQGDLRYWVGRMAADLRRANYDPTGVNASTNRFTLQTFTSTSLTWTTDLNSNGVIDTNPVETTGYQLSSGSLLLLQNGGTRTVVTGLTNATLFNYLDGSGAAYTPPDTTTSSRRAIAGVELTLTAQAATGGSPGVAKPTIQETVRVQFRNIVY